MKGNGRRNVWLVLGLVAMACLVLAGCPHNGLLEGGGGAGGIGGGSRGGGGGVQLVITNFVADGAASRSAWLGGPQRTIAPTTISLTNQDEIEKYVFVAYGDGGGVYGPEFINIASGTGIVGLGISGSGTWNVFVEGYDVDKLKAGGATGNNKEEIMKQNDAADIVQRYKDSAMVLRGAATVDLSGGSGKSVSLTLTNDMAGTEGEVDIAVYFTKQTDVQTIFDGAVDKYIVRAELINLVTQQVVMVGGDSTSVTLYEKKPGQHDTSEQNYTYRIYEKGTDTYTDQTITAVQDTTKILRYKPTSAGGQNLKIPKGKYMLLVTLENTDDDTELYRADYDFYVEGNMTTTGVFQIDSILGVTPTQPSALEVYWNTPTTTDTLVGYNADLVWGESDHNAVGYTLEIADITRIYKYEGQAMKVSVNGGQDEPFTNSQTLWAILDDTSKIPAPEDYVTRLDWRTTPQDHQGIPRWISGSLLTGNTALTLRLETGKVYTARIRAVNGSNSFSPWQYVGVGATTPPGRGETKFDTPTTNGIYDLMKFTYILKSVDMWTLTAQRQNMEVDSNADKQVTGEELLQVGEYKPATPTQLRYAFEGDTVGANTGDQVLVPGGTDLKIVTSWLGWQDTKNGGNLLFGPVDKQTTPAGGTWAKTDWKYSGFNDLELIPVGAGGSSIKIQAETAGTFNVLNTDTLGFGTAEPNNTTNKSTLAGLVQFATNSTKGIYKNAAGNRLVVVLKRDRTQVPVSYEDFELFVSVGDMAAGTDQVTATLTDYNGNKMNVTNIKATIEMNTNIHKTSNGFMDATADVPAYCAFRQILGNALMGMASNDSYQLRVQITVNGYTQSTTVPLSILYEDQVANSVIP